MDGTQMDAYYGDQLYVLERALDDLNGVNWNGLHHWLSARATWTTPPLAPDRLAIIREHAGKLCGVLNQEWPYEVRPPRDSYQDSEHGA